MRFLRIFPYAYYFCRKAGGCDCRSLDHKFKARRACHNCGSAFHFVTGHACLLHVVCCPALAIASSMIRIGVNAFGNFIGLQSVLHVSYVAVRACCYLPVCCYMPPLHCRHGPASHYCWWNKYVANPIKAWGYSGKGRTAMRVLKVCSVIGSCLLFIVWPATQQQAWPANLILLSNSITSELLNLLWAVTGGDPACHPAAPHQGWLRRRAVTPAQVRLLQAAA